MTKASEKAMKEVTPKRHKSWMTSEIMDQMEQRRRFKNNREAYINTNKTIRSKIRKAKEEWYEGKCREIEGLLEKNDNFNLHKKVKELTNGSKSKKHSILLDKNGKMLTDASTKIKRWKEYIEELFEDQRTDNYAYIEGDNIGPEITTSEVKYAVQGAKTNKALGPDQIPAEMLKLVEEENLVPITELFNTIYSTGIIPTDWLSSKFITLPKKPNAKQCSDHRTISLMSHTLKIFLKIIHNRIRKKLEDELGDTQFGFRDALGTREALFAFNVLMQRCMDANQPVHVCFLDYNKAFDKVRHDRLIEILMRKNLDSRDVRIINNLYFNQTAIIEEETETSEEIEIKRGVRQGCVLSPLLFNIYSEEIIKEALEEKTAGIRINGIPINNLRYADDTVLVAESAIELQDLLDRIVEVSSENGLTLNIQKTKYMIVTKSEQDRTDVFIQGERIEQVRKYNYLGTIVNENNEYSEEIKTRIGKARSAFNNMRHVFKSGDLSLNLKTRLLRCYVFTVLLYGMETWTLHKTTIDKLEAFEMWVYRRILRISWVDKVTNMEVLRRMGKEKEILQTIQVRKIQYLGHIMRNSKYQLLQVIMQGKIQGRRSRGRRRTSWLKNLRDWCNCSSIELFRAAASRVKTAILISNLLRGDGT